MKMLAPMFGCVLAASVPAGALAQAPAANAASDAKRSIYILQNGPDASVEAPAVSPEQLDKLNAAPAVNNAASVSLDIIPGREAIAGSKLGFRITTQKQGYLILVNVDATGRLTQIFPSIRVAGDDGNDEPGVDGANLLRPGKPLTIPQVGTSFANFAFVAQPPGGLAMVVALLSDRPVQVVDLPDAPVPAFAPADALKYVRDKTMTLIVPNENGRDWKRPNWSFDSKFYLIK